MGYKRGFRPLGWVIIVVGTIATTTLIVVSEGLPKDVDNTVKIFPLLLLIGLMALAVGLAFTAVVQGGISILAWVIPWVIRGFKE